MIYKIMVWGIIAGLVTVRPVLAQEQVKAEAQEEMQGQAQEATQAQEAAQGQEQTQATDKQETPETKTISVTGRLILKTGEAQDWLLIHATDAKAYYVKGEFLELLKSLLSDLGEENLVSVEGVKDGSFNLTCHNKYSFDIQGNRIMDSVCVRYYGLEVTQIIDAKQSDQDIPHPERDAEEEQRAKMSALTHFQQQQSSGLQMVAKDCKIRALNLRTPVKTIQVSFLDKNERTVNKTLLLTPDTVIAKKGPDTGELMFLGPNYLQKGQELHVEYSQDGRNNVALFVTVLKEKE